jgi:hypothetical protein
MVNCLRIFVQLRIAHGRRAGAPVLLLPPSNDVNAAGRKWCLSGLPDERVDPISRGTTPPVRTLPMMPLCTSRDGQYNAKESVVHDGRQRAPDGE